MRRLYKYTTFVFVDFNRLTEEEVKELLAEEFQQDGDLELVESIEQVPEKWRKCLPWDERWRENELEPITIEDLIAQGKA